MRMTVILELDGRSIQIPCGGCGSLLKISLLRQGDQSISSQDTEQKPSNRSSLGKDALRLLIVSVPTEAVPPQA